MNTGEIIFIALDVDSISKVVKMYVLSATIETHFDDNIAGNWRLRVPRHSIHGPRSDDRRGKY